MYYINIFIGAKTAHSDSLDRVNTLHFKMQQLAEALPGFPKIENK